MTTSLYLAISADGLIATLNRVSDEDSEWSESAWKCWCDHCTTSNNLIVGRKTYTELTQIDASDILHPDHKVVVSSRDLDLADTWVQFPSPKQAVDYLKSCGIENVIVGGGRQLGLAFVKDGLIDEIVLDIQPILFGSGTPLLGELDRCIQLELVNNEKLGHGAIRVHYKLLKD
jgi:dihydrofolate reductase